MIITSVDIYKYALPLTGPFSVGGQPLSQRQGYLIHLMSGQEIEGFGDVSPLPGLSEESLQEALDQLLALKRNLPHASIPAGIERLNGKLDDWFNDLALMPSVRFGVESALLHLIAQSKSVSLSKLLSSKASDSVRIHGLLSGSKEQVIQDTLNLIDQGFTAFKLKVGSDRIEEDIDKVRTLNAVLSGRALVHADANQAWDLNQALYFGREVGCASITYIEEPFADITQIPEFYDQTLIPVALDESLKTHKLDDLKSIDGLEMLILKPTLLGGIEKTWQILSQARRFGWGVGISSAFESGVGLITLAQLSAASHLKSSAGLDTLKWFKTDLLREKFPLEKGKVNTTRGVIRSADLDFNLLERII
ncbi:MAG: o-succinylbenzoate synthase [Omnitrophica WOR_2 bacterium GWA2_45_18]|nr:MAG: o-succinylbenzoate synthase [Omnitrophica WOR_2 bacterium GWA2_45_18]